MRVCAGSGTAQKFGYVRIVGLPSFPIRKRDPSPINGSVRVGVYEGSEKYKKNEDNILHAFTIAVRTIDFHKALQPAPKIRQKRRDS